MAKQDLKEIQTIFPEAKEVEAGGEKHIIRPFGFGKFPKVLALLEKAVSSLQSSEFNLEKLDNQAIFQLIARNAEHALSLVKLATGKDDKFFEDLPADEGLNLLMAVVEVNRDFFVNRLLPKMEGLVSKLSESVGGVSSPASSVPATD